MQGLLYVRASRSWMIMMVSGRRASGVTLVSRATHHVITANHQTNPNENDCSYRLLAPHTHRIYRSEGVSGVFILYVFRVSFASFLLYMFARAPLSGGR
jgi:hypothetical protein